MVTLQRSDDYLQLSDKYHKEAIAILQDVDNLSAENFEKANKLSEASIEYLQKSEAMQELESKKNDFIANQQNEKAPEGDPNSAENKAKQAQNFGYKNLGEWLKAIYHLKSNGFMHKNGLQWWDGDGDGRSKVVHIKESKALAENTGATGGFLVPVEFDARVLQVMETESVIRPRANVIRMNRRETQIPALDQTGTVTGGFSWFGGAVSYWEAEAATLTASNMTFRNVNLTAHKLTALTRTSNELLDDSAISLQDFIMSILPREIAHQVDYACLQGDGVGKPQGIITAGATITVNREGTNNVTYNDLTSMLAKALPSANSIWVASQSVLSTLLTMNGPSGNASYLWGSAERGVPNSLLGRPIIFTDKLPALGTAGDIMYIDASYYLFGDRQATTIDMSIHESFTSDQATWRAIMRCDGMPWLSAPITYKDGSTQVSPFVLLGNKST